MNILEEMSPRLSVEKVSPNGEMVAVQIRNVTKDVVNYGQGDTDEYVLWLEGHAKGVRLNTTNAKNIVACLGTGETTDWIGRWVHCQGHWVRTPQGNEVFSWRFDKNPIPGQPYGPTAPVAAAPAAGPPAAGPPAAGPQPGYDPSQAAQYNDPNAAPAPGSTAMPGHGAPPAHAAPAAAPPPAGSVPTGGPGGPPPGAAAGPAAGAPPPSGAPAGPAPAGPEQPPAGQQWPPPAQNWNEAQAGEQAQPDDVDFMDEGEEDDEEPEPAPEPAKKPRRRRRKAADAAPAAEAQ